MKLKISIIASLWSLLILGAGCKKALDVNTDPNVARNAPVSMLLTSSQLYLSSVVSTEMGINAGLWAQYWTQSTASSQYKTFEQYSPSASTYDRGWGLIYNQALTDLDIVQTQALVQNKKEYVALAMIMKAYAFQLATDAWGDIPFSDALQGETNQILNPKFDNQASVYKGINTLLNDAKGILDSFKTLEVEGDVMFKGDHQKWYQFANTLQLRANLRLAEKSPAEAQAGVEALYAAIAASGIGFLESDAMITFLSVAGNQHPLYAEMVGLRKIQNIVASSTVVDSMIANDDPRRFKLFSKISGEVKGIPQGAYNLPASTPRSIPAPVTGADAANTSSATASVIFISSWESYFLQAEAKARYASLGGDGAAEFKTGIEKSMAFLGADGVNYIDSANWAQFPATGTVQDKIKVIITQKWFSMCGLQNFEAWTEQRRTGYPNFFVQSANSIIGTGKFPGRFFYPNAEVTRNTNFPGQVTIDQKVWWDAN